jgi:hypothetical protein
MSVYPTEKTPNTQPNTLSLMPSSKDMSLLAEEMQTRSNMVKNAREHKHATTWLRREGPFVFIGVSRTGLEARVRRLVHVTSSQLEVSSGFLVIDFSPIVKREILKHRGLVATGAGRSISDFASFPLSITILMTCGIHRRYKSTAFLPPRLFSANPRFGAR